MHPIRTLSVPFHTWAVADVTESDERDNIKILRWAKAARRWRASAQNGVVVTRMHRSSAELAAQHFMAAGCMPIEELPFLSVPSQTAMIDMMRYARIGIGTTGARHVNANSLAAAVEKGIAGRHELSASAVVITTSSFARWQRAHWVNAGSPLSYQDSTQLVVREPIGTGGVLPNIEHGLLELDLDPVTLG